MLDSKTFLHADFPLLTNGSRNIPSVPRFQHFDCSNGPRGAIFIFLLASLFLIGLGSIVIELSNRKLHAVS